MSENDLESLTDYKFYCFNGQVKAMVIITERHLGIKTDYYDKQFNRLPISQGRSGSVNEFSKPDNFDEMIEISETLSAGLPHVRVDLYSINGKVYFGEMTFFDDNGFRPIEPEEWENRFGDWIELPKKTF